MMHFCTVFDGNYARKGCALYASLVTHLDKHFTLHVLCVDQEAFDMMRVFNAENISLTKLEMLETIDPALLITKKLPPTNYGSQRDNYIWALAPYFTDYIIRNKLSVGEKIMYVDSDIYFYKSPQLIFDKVGDKQMGVHTHRFGVPYNENHDVGYFNVGVVVFKKVDADITLHGYWKQLVMTTDHSFYEKYGTCGDQKYLEVLYGFRKEQVCVFDEDGEIHHGAPWCEPDQDLSKLNFYHFSHFTLLYDDGAEYSSYIDSHKGEWNPSRVPHVRSLYDGYRDMLVKFKF